MSEHALYPKLVVAVDVSVIEADIRTKGIFIMKDGLEPKIYIKKDLEQKEKLKVLLHEYIHYIHLTKFYEQECRAECEIIAESSVFFILRELGITMSNNPVLEGFTNNEDKTKCLSVKIQQICNEIISKLK